MLDLSWIKWTPDELKAAAKAALVYKREEYERIKAIPAEQRTFTNTIGALEWANDRLADMTQITELLINVHPEVSVRDAAQSVAELIDRENIALEYDHGLWKAVNEWVVDSEQLSDPDKKLYTDRMRDMRRMGFALQDEKFAQLKKLTEELQKTEQDFERAINDYDDHIKVSREQLGGLPERYIESLRRADDGEYIVSLQYPDIIPFMEYADDDALRRELASKNLRKGGQANLERLTRILELRQAIAGILDYPTYADYAEEVRMSKTASVVKDFLEDIIKRLAPAVQAELRDLIAVKQRILGLEKPAPIHFNEVAYWAQKLKKERYDIDPEILKEYFPLPRVLKGVFDIYQDILGVHFKKIDDAALWHSEAQLYAVHNNGSDEIVGHFILDLHPRIGKYGHAAAFSPILARVNEDGNRTTGLMVLVCNFPKSTAKDPSLISHDDVETLLHEFGHICHGLLSGGRWQHQNGMCVALDFVEALSQMLEHWAWDERSLAKLSSHYLTDEPIPHELAGKLISSRRHMQASYYTAQAVRALYDLRMHTQSTDSAVEEDVIAKLYRDMKLEYEHIELPEDAIIAAGWGHLAGGYDAGYYSYLWSKVYASDLYTRFNPDPLDAVVGADYRAKVLSPGASRPEKSLVEDFLGRESNSAAFLKELGV